ETLAEAWRHRAAEPHREDGWIHVARLYRVVDRRIAIGSRLARETRELAHDTDDFIRRVGRCAAPLVRGHVAKPHAESIRSGLPLDEELADEHVVDDDRVRRSDVGWKEAAAREQRRIVGAEQVQADVE